MEKYKIWLLRLLGAIMAGFAISVFFTPNKIVCGGFSGIAIICFHLFSIPTAVVMMALNVTFLLLGLKILGKSVVINTIIGSSLLTLFVQVFSYIPPITNDVLLASLFGGIIYGVGIGIVLATGSTSGGTDIPGRMLQYFFPDLHIGTVLLGLDGLIISMSLVVFKEVELCLYGIIALFLSSYMVDWLIKKLNTSVIAFVISEKGEKIARELIAGSRRGVTVMDVMGAYTNGSKKMLFCALKEKETIEFQRKITEIDNEAFVVFSESQKIWGRGFHIYQ